MIGKGPKINNKEQLSKEELMKIQPDLDLSEEELEKVNEEIERELNNYLEEKNKKEESIEKSNDLKFYGVVIVLFFFIVLYKLIPMFIDIYKDFN